MTPDKFCSILDACSRTTNTVSRKQVLLDGISACTVCLRDNTFFLYIKKKKKKIINSTYGLLISLFLLARVWGVAGEEMDSWLLQLIPRGLLVPSLSQMLWQITLAPNQILKCTWFGCISCPTAACLLSPLWSYTGHHWRLCQSVIE